MFYDPIKFYTDGAGVYLGSRNADLLSYSRILVIACANEGEARQVFDALNSDSVAGRIAAANATLVQAADRWEFGPESDSVRERAIEGTRALIDDLLRQPMAKRDSAPVPAAVSTVDVGAAIKEMRTEWNASLDSRCRRQFEGKYLAALIAVLLTTWPIEGGLRRARRECKRRDRVVQLLRDRPSRHLNGHEPPQPLGWGDVKGSWRSKLTGTSRKMAAAVRVCAPTYGQADKCWAAIGIAARAVHAAMRLPVWREGEVDLVGHHVDLEAQLVGFTRAALDLAAAVNRVDSEKPRGYAANIAALRQLYEASMPALEEAWAALVERLEALLVYTGKISEMQQLRDQGARAPRLEALQRAADGLVEVNAAHALGAAELRNAAVFADEYLQSRRDAHAILGGD